MRKIDIANLESRMQAPTTGDLKTQGVEDSPLLVGLQFVPSSGDA